MSNAILEINKKAIIHNLEFFKSKLHNKTKILAVVKAFSYGSDAVLISRILEKNKVNYLAVAYINEGIALRKSGIILPILVLHPQINDLERLIEYELEPNLYSEFILNTFLKITFEKDLSNYPIHIKFNTGLNRLGFNFNEINSVINKVKKNKNVKIASIFSHLVASEDFFEQDFTNSQIDLFTKIKNQATELLDYQPLFHLLNTSGIVNYPNAQFDMVRLGIGLYGITYQPTITQKLKNVLTLKSTISQIHILEKGKSVGYNRAFTTSKKTKIATIAIGHADGISRKLGNNVGIVTINNQKAPIIGNVCMDMIMIDITDINCKENDEVILFDSQIDIENMAEKIGTIPYELLTMISQRVKRVIV